ncbi:hypothetical protein JQC81_20215 [Microvirga arabica]|nr:hypothetical protein [Microvirga arabica]
MVADPLFPVPPYAQKDDPERNAAALDQRQQGGSSNSSILQAAKVNAAVPGMGCYIVDVQHHGDVIDHQSAVWQDQRRHLPQWVERQQSLSLRFRPKIRISVTRCRMPAEVSNVIAMNSFLA